MLKVDESPIFWDLSYMKEYDSVNIYIK